MDYTLLAAAHARREISAKMDASCEQAYYESALESSQRLESLLETAVFPISLARNCFALAKLAPSHIRAVALHFSFGWKARKSLS
jgi:hypothetical protein